ncbi:MULTISPECIES: glycosyltransferase [Rhodococcus]|jgi:colanic acid biosynthesis glycosyl transferase WcaI|nr:MULTISPECIES: glycosyltransferase [Rhodococcus]AZI60798.1 glycosyltransferase WbuB [Rhodococcus sp. NJ-530]REK80573.1 glycosyltransferase WbuB [Rhodococcus erythropolis]MCT6736602.1 glycosyltransferase [Rhodococcus qingshengii]MDA3635037.1 glycosyltransferase [Rhodococcus sp. C-2]QOS64722.1 glycosyltransferase [Rhodococcus qingshengii]
MSTMDNQGNKILIVGINYSPEPTGIAPYTEGLANAIADAGADVRVVTGYPHYPFWRKMDGFSGLSSVEQSENLTVQRLRHYIPRNPSFLRRILMEASFALRATWATLFHRADLILCLSPTLLSSAAFVIRTRLLRSRTPVVLWVQDFYGLGASETGQLSGGLSSLVDRAESWILRKSDHVVVIHPRFAKHAQDNLGVDSSSVTVIRNWTHLDLSQSACTREDSRKRLGWGPEQKIVLHAGNMGAKQGLENVVNAAHLLGPRQSDIKFVLMGDGNQRAHLEELSEGCTGIEFMDPVGGEDFTDVLRAADALLLNELADLRSMAVPSKLTSYFASGVPVVAATSSDSASGEEIALSGAGVRVDAGNPEALVREIEMLVSDPVRAAQLARNGGEYVHETLSPGSATTAFGDLFDGLINRDSLPTRPTQARAR